jgi:hypothetical protein
MCRSIAEGGQRCAAHTRAAFEHVSSTYPASGPEWMDAAAAYASTKTGESYFESELISAVAHDDFEVQGRINSALQAGRTQRLVNAESRLAIQKAQSSTPVVDGKPTRFVGDSTSVDGVRGLYRVFRPYDRRLNNVRYVEEPAGTCWSVNKHGVVVRNVPSPFMDGWFEMTFPKSPDQERDLRKVARSVDTKFKPCKCC